MSTRNVFDVLEQCLKCDVDSNLLKKCKEVLQKRTKEVLKYKAFLVSSLECLIVLLEQEILSVTEGELFKAVNLLFKLVDS